ncbi:hypothetical protein [Nocardia caishijiensis]|uniref:Uncharacterized protein n=1 Tax=Nocardia caishijiensis TaxID=184756 RepID=A0ABQ6YRE9_9NOCA|nr:hypothetical protein [Nocardia caishijiensis]KAF0848350.1 hypothetical protein FNL39_102498 [Nocardia caishijiensis]
MAPLPARNYQDQYYEYGEPHRCGGACGRPGCHEVPQGYSPTVPIRDEGYGQRLEAESARGGAVAVPRPSPRSRSLIAVVAILLATLVAGLVGIKLGSDIDLFGAAETAVVQRDAGVDT